MNRIPIIPDLAAFPAQFRPLLQGAAVYDSSCSQAAKVYFIDRDGGLYLKTAAKGTLEREAKLTAFFHNKGLSAQVLAYESLEADWLLTTRIPGEDCTHPVYLEDPKRLCDTTAQLLRLLHDQDTVGCPVPNRTEEYLATARRNYGAGAYDASLFPDNWGYATAEEAWRVVAENGKYLQADTLLHGDYCLPNILLDNWRFSGFIDLDTGGVGDRHVDLFWGAWSLQFNLKTDAYTARFLDAYGREMVEEDLLRTVAAVEVFG